MNERKDEKKNEQREKKIKAQIYTLYIYIYTYIYISFSHRHFAPFKASQLISPIKLRFTYFIFVGFACARFRCHCHCCSFVCLVDELLSFNDSFRSLLFLDCNNFIGISLIMMPTVLLPLLTLNNKTSQGFFFNDCISLSSFLNIFFSLAVSIFFSFSVHCAFDAHTITLLTTNFS